MKLSIKKRKEKKKRGLVLNKRKDDLLIKKAGIFLYWQEYRAQKETKISQSVSGATKSNGTNKVTVQLFVNGKCGT